MRLLHVPSGCAARATRSMCRASYASIAADSAKRLGAWLEYMPWWNALFVDPPLPRAGMLQLSDAPGLGSTLDERAVTRSGISV